MRIVAGTYGRDDGGAIAPVPSVMYIATSTPR